MSLLDNLLLTSVLSNGQKKRCHFPLQQLSTVKRLRELVRQRGMPDIIDISQAGITAKLPSLATPYTLLNRAKNLKIYFKAYHFSPSCLLIT